jgi:uncharacterized membrane protein
MSEPINPPESAVKPVKPHKKHRVFLWFFLVLQLAFLAWIIAGGATAGGTPADCGNLSVDTCNDAEAVGTSIGVALIVGLWVIVDFLVAVCYGIYRLARRPAQ